jgi:hypothetical protein
MNTATFSYHISYTKYLPAILPRTFVYSVKRIIYMGLPLAILLLRNRDQLSFFTLLLFARAGRHSAFVQSLVLHVF